VSKIPLRLWRVLEGLNAVEFVVVVVLAALLVIAGPLVVASRFVGQGQYVVAAMLSALWIVCVGICARDIRRGTLGWISGGMVAAWVVAMFVVGWAVQ
jgi:hypothetical protein